MNIRAYVRTTHPAVLAIELIRAFAVLAMPVVGLLLVRWLATADAFVAPLHRRLWFHPAYREAGTIYKIFVAVTFGLTGAWVTSSFRTFVTFTLRRTGRDIVVRNAHDEKLPLPAWPYSRESFTVILGELQDRDGARVPSERYYTLFDYLETLIDDTRQNTLQEKALSRHAADPERVMEIERRWKAILRRRNEMSVNLRGALEACARAGIDMFRFRELRRTFCPTRDEYFERDEAAGVLRPRANVFTGFDQVLDHGRIVGLDMPKNVYFDAAVFTQVALKSQWQDSVLRREAVGSDGRALLPPRFGNRIGYCPTFLMADEAQQSATPKDAEFKAVCRSKRASMWELTQSHGSIRGAFGPQRAADANTYFQNSMTHIYLRQSDIDSMKTIQEECGKKLVQRTSLAITEGGRASELSYIQGGIIHDAVGLSATKTVATEEKPFVEIDELKGLPNNVAVILPSNGDRTLPATIAYLRPLWVFKKRPDVSIETSWLDWPTDLRATYDLDSIPQQTSWRGWGLGLPMEESALVPLTNRLGKFVQTLATQVPPSSSPTRVSSLEAAPVWQTSVTPDKTATAPELRSRNDVHRECTQPAASRTPGDVRGDDPFAGIPDRDD